MATANRTTTDQERTTVQLVALIFGLGFTLVAILGFLTSRGSMDPDPMTAPRVLGLFPVNLPHNLLHLAFGLWGLAASRTWSASKSYAQITGVAYALLVLLGFVSPTMFGLAPIGSHDLWLHAIIALPLLYFGFASREPARGPAGAV